MLALGSEAHDLGDLTLEELGRLEVTSVSKSPELLSEAPAAVYVITQEDIRRSGATTLVEALRLAPNLRITQLGAGNHTASTRGFGGHLEAQNFSNKLLLLIDGRSVYSPLFSGIYLDSHDVVLADVERIEVVSGPGAALWGANAVNGVINVITRPAYLSAGTAVTATAGSDLQRFTGRIGERAGDQGAWRAYVKALRSDAMDSSEDLSAGDSWRRAQTGFRLDLTRPGGDLTAQGDAYKGEHERPGSDSERLTGANLLARWTGRTERSRLQLQAYFDHVQRHTQEQEGQRVNTFDLDIQQDLQAGPRHEIVWGAGARVHRYRIYNAQNLQFEPDARTLELYNLFAQDTISMRPGVRLTLGLKLEHNSFSRWEPQPHIRLAWQAGPSVLGWAAASRAIRSPTPFDTDVVEYLEGVRFLVGNPDFRPEEVMAYEAGLRLGASTGFWMSLSAFYNEYDDLRTIELDEASGFLPLYWGNRMAGQTYGLNAWATWQVTDWWRLRPGFELLRQDLRFKAGASGLLGTAQAGNDPRGHASLVSSMQLGGRHGLELALRHVGALPDPALEDYTELSARYFWRATGTLELSLRGTSLLHGSHREYPASGGALIRRAVMAEARWRR